jgi:hypothetical protein
LGKSRHFPLNPSQISNPERAFSTDTSGGIVSGKSAAQDHVPRLVSECQNLADLELQKFPIEEVRAA